MSGQMIAGVLLILVGFCMGFAVGGMWHMLIDDWKQWALRKTDKPPPEAQ